MKEFDFRKYLRKNPSAVPPGLAGYRHAAVIPVYDESEYFPSAVGSFRAALSAVAEKIALIAVVNYPPGASDAQSAALMEEFGRGRFPGVIPIFLPELKGGVGAARKAGMDAFIASLRPEDAEKSVIFSLDADTAVSPDYFRIVAPCALRGGAVSIGFSHLPATDPASQLAIDRYEAYLAGYVARLRAAGSPYAFFTVGSAFAVRCDAYIRAGGMKVRTAGEDFYFLQAVAKTSGVSTLPDKLVFPSPRVSRRVPFGTGRAVDSLLSGGGLPEIPDHAFRALEAVLLAAGGSLPSGCGAFLRDIPEKAADFFIREGFPAAWEKILGSLPGRPDALASSFHLWFDGLKTLRFLHFLS